MTLTPPTAGHPAPPDPADTIRSLNAIIKALVRAYGTPEATVPLSIVTTLTQTQVTQAYALTLTISPQPADVNPEPWLLIKVEGM